MCTPVQHGPSSRITLEPAGATPCVRSPFAQLHSLCLPRRTRSDTSRVCTVLDDDDTISRSGEHGVIYSIHSRRPVCQPWLCHGLQCSASADVHDDARARAAHSWAPRRARDTAEVQSPGLVRLPTAAARAGCGGCCSSQCGASHTWCASKNTAPYLCIVCRVFRVSCISQLPNLS